MSKEEVLKLMDDGELLCNTFYIRNREWSIKKNRITSRTAKAVIKTEGVNLYSVNFEGFLKHYYKKES